MTRDELLKRICPIAKVTSCGKGDFEKQCDECSRLLNQWFDAYDATLKEKYGKENDRRNNESNHRK